MKYSSHWLLAVSILAVAFSCQCQTKRSENSPEEPPPQSQEDQNKCDSMCKEKSTSQSTDAQQSAAPSISENEKSASSVQAIVETRAEKQEGTNSVPAKEKSTPLSIVETKPASPLESAAAPFIPETNKTQPSAVK